MLRTMTVAGAVTLAFALSGCDVEQTREAKLPEVDVEGGQMPQYDVDAPEVEVGTEERVVTVPDVDVGTEERTVTVPDVDIRRADADDERRDGG